MSTSLRVILFVASLCVFFFIMKKIKKAIKEDTLEQARKKFYDEYYRKD